MLLLFLKAAFIYAVPETTTIKSNIRIRGEWTGYSVGYSVTALTIFGYNGYPYTITLSHCKFLDLISSQNAGAVMCYTMLEMENCEFYRCRTSTTGPTGYGGAVYATRQVRIWRCSFDVCSAVRGSAVYANFESATYQLVADDSNFTTCSATGYGTLCIYQGTSINTIRGCTFAECIGVQGGTAVYRPTTTSAELVVEKCSFSESTHNVLQWTGRLEMSECGFIDCGISNPQNVYLVNAGQLVAEDCKATACKKCTNVFYARGEMDVKNCSFSDCSVSSSLIYSTGQAFAENCTVTSCTTDSNLFSTGSGIETRACSFRQCTGNGRMYVIMPGSSSPVVAVNCTFTACRESRALLYSTRGIEVSECLFSDCSLGSVQYIIQASGSGKVVAVNCTLARCTSGSNLFYLDVAMQLIECSFSDCTGTGGVIYASAELAAENCSFTACKQWSYVLSGRGMDVADCSFSDCDVSSYAIYCGGSELVTKNCTFTTCTLGTHGAMYASSCPVKIEWCRFEDCKSDDSLGIIYVVATNSVDLQFSTFKACGSVSGGGILYIDSSTLVSLNIENVVATEVSGSSNVFIHSPTSLQRLTCANVVVSVASAESVIYVHPALEASFENCQFSAKGASVRTFVSFSGTRTAGLFEYRDCTFADISQVSNGNQAIISLSPGCPVSVVSCTFSHVVSSGNYAIRTTVGSEVHLESCKFEASSCFYVAGTLANITDCSITVEGDLSKPAFYWYGSLDSDELLFFKCCFIGISETSPYPYISLNGRGKIVLNSTCFDQSNDTSITVDSRYVSLTIPDSESVVFGVCECPTELPTTEVEIVTPSSSSSQQEEEDVPQSASSDEGTISSSAEAAGRSGSSNGGLIAGAVIGVLIVAGVVTAIVVVLVLRRRRRRSWVSTSDDGGPGETTCAKEHETNTSDVMVWDEVPKSDAQKQSDADQSDAGLPWDVPQDIESWL